MSALGDEIAQLLTGGQNKIDGAEEIISQPNCSSRAADIAYNAVADGVNLVTKAFLRKQGYAGLSDESAPALLGRAMGDAAALEGRRRAKRE